MPLTFLSTVKSDSTHVQMTYTYSDLGGSEGGMYVYFIIL